MTTYHHEPVMVDELVEIVAGGPGGTAVDANLGGGGHAEAVLDARPDMVVIGLDRDPDAVEAAGRRLERFGDRVLLHQIPFDQMAAAVLGDGLDPLAAAWFDLGVSGHQLDVADRGFSYRQDGPLDMRFGAEGPTAADIVNEASQAELRRLLVEYADERHATRISRAIVAARPLSTTGELARVVADAVPAAARRRGHPARRTFQALRMAVNDELGQLRRALDQALSLLMPGGRLAVLAYHGGEDTIVKRRLREAAGENCTCPPGLPCQCGAHAEVRLLGRGARTPADEEIARNPRARSARLRAAEKLDSEEQP